MRYRVAHRRAAAQSGLTQVLGIMTKRKGAWTTKDRLEAMTYVVAIVGGISAAVLYFSNSRAQSISQARTELLRTWTNEGDITSTETHFIDLKLESFDGDIAGTLSSPQLDSPLDVAVDVGWHSSTLSITQLRGRSVVPIAEVKVALSGNNNRLGWDTTSTSPPAYLPPSTILWPLPAEPSH